MNHTMPKVYYYTDDEVGVPWPGPDADRVEYCKQYNIPHPRFTWYDWPGFTTTTNPTDADVFCIRQRLIWLDDEQIHSLPYLPGNEHRHVFFGLGPDGDSRAYRDLSDIPAVFIRACCTRSMLKTDPDIIAWPWPVDDLSHYYPIPNGFKYDITFQGQVLGCTEPALKSIERSRLHYHIRRMDTFWPGIRKQDPMRAAMLQSSYFSTMSASRLALSPRSNRFGAIRYRLYEAMSMGRVNVHLGDECALPLPDKIAWANCLIQYAERDASRIGEFIGDWLSDHTDEDIIAMGAYARRMWKKYLWRGNWGKVIGGLVRERLKL